jgi:hypothetical protein
VSSHALRNFTACPSDELVGQSIIILKIPHHKVGTHRRVTFKDLLVYEKLRDQTRRDALDGLSDVVDKAGLYFSDFKGEE